MSKYHKDCWNPWTKKSSGVLFKSNTKGTGDGEEKLAKEFDTQPLGQNSLHDLVVDGEKWEVKKLDKKGFPLSRIILDPGIGFGKNLQHNLKILKNIDIICNLGFHTLIVTSRKSFIGDLLKCPPEERLEGTISSNLYAIIQGVKIIRVHDVLEVRKALTILEKILKA